MLRRIRPFALLVGVNVVFLCVLSFYGTSHAAPRAVPGQFANAIAQRQEMIDQLKEMNRLLAEQNRLLQSGKLKVIVASKKPN